jgi:hypothetical protein
MWQKYDQTEAIDDLSKPDNPNIHEFNPSFKFYEYFEFSFVFIYIQIYFIK